MCEKGRIKILVLNSGRNMHFELAVLANTSLNNESPE